MCGVSWHFDSIRILHLSLAVLLSTLGKRFKFAPGSALIQDYLYYNTRANREIQHLVH